VIITSALWPQHGQHKLAILLPKIPLRQLTLGASLAHSAGMHKVTGVLQQVHGSTRHRVVCTGGGAQHGSQHGWQQEPPALAMLGATTVKHARAIARARTFVLFIIDSSSQFVGVVSSSRIFYQPEVRTNELLLRRSPRVQEWGAVRSVPSAHRRVQRQPPFRYERVILWESNIGISIGGWRLTGPDVV
jgi:hypothetical protein